MPYRIVQISQPYLAYESYGGNAVTTPCYVVGSENFSNPEEAHRSIDFMCTGKYPNMKKLEKDWFIVIQTF